MYNERVGRNQVKYQMENVKQYGVRFNCNTEADFIDWIEKQPNKLGYIKELIRKDMIEHGVIPNIIPSDHRTQEARENLKKALQSDNPARWYFENTGVTNMPNASNALSKAKKRYPDIVAMYSRDIRKEDL